MADLETPDPPAPEPVAAPEPEPAPDPIEAEPEGTVDVAGQKHVPVGALIAERREKQALKQKAEQYDQLAGYVHQVRPYIDFLAANPGLMTRTQQDTAPTPVTTTQPTDQKAEVLARTLDLYTASGEPDVKRAQAIREMIRGEAEEQAEAKVKPLQESTARERANYNYQRALITKSPDGRAVDKDTLDAIWSRTDSKITATEEGAAGVVAMALGLSVMRGGSQPPPVTQPLAAPLHTEPAGGRHTGKLSLSQLDEQIAKLRNIPQKEYADRVKNYQPGRPNQLED